MFQTPLCIQAGNENKSARAGFSTQKEKTKLQKAAKNSAALEQAKEMFSFNISGDSEDDQPDVTSTELQAKLEKQKKQIEQLQKQLNKTKG